MRAALEYAIDRAAINKVVYAGVGRPAYQPFPPNSPGYNKQVGNKYVYDPKKAKAMLAAAGYPHGISFKLDVPANDTTFQRLATIIQSEMAAAGFKVNIQLIPGSDILVDVYLKKQGDALLSEDLTNGPDISNTFEAVFEPSGFPAQYLGTEDLALAPDVEAANASLSPKLQGPLMQKVGRRRHGPGSRDAHRVRAVDHRLQQVGGGREGGRRPSASAARTWPASTSRSERRCLDAAGSGIRARPADGCLTLATS